MPNYKLRYKILANGFPITKEMCVIDGFLLKQVVVKEEELTKSKNEFSSKPLFFFSCTYKLENGDNRYYNYFENIELINLKVPKKIKRNEEEIVSYITDKKIALATIKRLERKIRLVYNILVVFPITNLYIYDENGKFLLKLRLYNDFPIENRIYEYDAESFYKKSHFDYNVDEILKIEKTNGNFRRAMDFFCQSFDSSNVSLRYILIFTALEALFNVDGKEIKEKLAKFSSKIMCFDDEKDKNIVYERIIHLYNKRCNYIHGSKTSSITLDDEKELRRYARIIILLYMTICNNYAYTDRQIINLLNSNRKLGFLTKIWAKRLNCDINSNDFYENIVKPETIKAINLGELAITEIKNGFITGVKERMK